MNIQNLVAMTKSDNSASALLQNKSTQEISALKDEETSSVASTAETGAAEEFDTFLTLLTAQIKNQDPLAPLDSTQFVEQLATFSQLELQANGNAVLENIASMLAENLYQLNGSDDS